MSHRIATDNLAAGSLEFHQGPVHFRGIFLMDEQNLKKAIADQLEMMVQHLNQDATLDYSFIRVHALLVYDYCSEIINNRLPKDS